MNICRQLHPTTAEHTFFSRSHGTFTNTNHILGHKTCLNTFKRIKNHKNTFIPQGDKLEIINRKIVGKFQNRLNNKLLINVWIEE